MKYINKFFFYFAWFFYLTVFIVLINSKYSEYIQNETFESKAKMLVVVLLFISIMMLSRYSLTSIILICLTLGIFLISSIVSDSQLMLTTILFALAAKDNIDIEKFLKMDIALRIVLISFVVVSSQIGIIENTEVIINGYSKLTFGFNHANMFGTLLGTVFAEYIFLFYDKVKFLHIAAIVSALILFYYIGVSRTSIISMMFILIMAILFKSNAVKKFVSKRYIFFSCINFFMWIFCFILTVIYNNKNNFMRMINQILSTRLYWSNFFFKKYGLSLFGNHIITISTEKAKILGVRSQIFDMGYVRLFVEYGLFVLIIFLVIHMLLCKYAIQSKNYGLYLSILYFSLTLFAEVSGYNIINNFTLLFAMQGFLSCNLLSKKKYTNILSEDWLKKKFNLRINLKG